MTDERDEDIFPMLENHVRMKPDEILCPGDMDKIIAVARRRIAWNKVKFAEMSQYVNGDISGEKLNPVYLARAEATRALKAALFTYTGSFAVASDELFRIKCEADAQGRDFTEVCNEEIAKMKGEHVVPSMSEETIMTRDELSKPEEKPKTLAGRVLHSLWAMGFPVQRFIKKELDVKEADK
jgi:hypothetical protein